jgi:hypothetical protein
MITALFFIKILEARETAQSFEYIGAISGDEGGVPFRRGNPREPARTAFGRNRETPRNCDE